MTYQEQRLAYINSGRPLKQKQPKPINKISKKRKQKLIELKESGSDSKLDIWFEAQRKMMSGRCCLCGGKTEKNNDETYRRSLHHLFEKRKNMFPSVACNMDNVLELCFWGNSCHQNIHNGTITWMMLLDSAEKEMILEKVKRIYPYIDESEKKNIPEILWQFINQEI